MSVRTIAGPGGRPYDIEVEPTTGFVLGQPRSFVGYRVSFRPAGARLWRRVTFVDHDHHPTDEEVCRAIEEVAGRGSFD